MRLPCRGCQGSMEGRPTGRKYCAACRPPLSPGDVVGMRTLVESVVHRGRTAWLTECQCGAEGLVIESDLYGGRARSCTDCFNAYQGRIKDATLSDNVRRRRVQSGEHTPTLAPGSDGPPYALNDLAYEDDPECQRFVDEHPSGATLEEVAVCFGLTRERVRQLEERALKKLARNAEVLSATRSSGLGWGSCPACRSNARAQGDSHCRPCRAAKTRARRAAGRPETLATDRGSPSSRGATHTEGQPQLPAAGRGGQR